MNNQLIRTLVALSAASAVILPLVGNVAVAQTPVTKNEPHGAEPGACAPKGKPEGLRPGDRVTDCGVTVLVPPRGHGIYEEHFQEDGRFQELTVETEEDGDVIIKDWGSETDGQTHDNGAGGTAPAACLDGEYDLKGWKWETTYAWKFYSPSRPDELSLLETETISTLRKATTNITHVNTDCNRADNVSAAASFDSAAAPSTTLCLGGSRDGVNTVRFSALTADQTDLAVACTRYNITSGRAEESDVVIDKDNHEWYVQWSSSLACQTSTEPDGFSLEAVMTHERGHNFGLGHDYELAGDPGEAAHGNLTMSPSIEGPCQNSESTLGLGDIQGLEFLY